MGVGTSYYDSDGEAMFLFGGVPIRAVKRAFFKNKLGTIHQLLKLAYNSVIYDFSKTAEGGAVIFENNYTEWEFIAPDNRLDFEGYTNMTLGEAFDAMGVALTDNPIPAWEQFAEWFNTIRNKVNLGTNAFYIYLKDANGIASTEINNFSFSKITTFVDFIETLKTACTPALNRSMADFKTSDTSFACILIFYNSSWSKVMSTTFKFRE